MSGMKNTNTAEARYANTPIGEVTEQAKHDMDLIKADVLLGNWDGVQRGIQWTIDALTDIQCNLNKLGAKGLLNAR